MEWFDLDTGLLTKKTWWEASTSGPLLVTSTVERWRMQEGLLQPSEMLVQRGELKYRVAVLKVEYWAAAKPEALKYSDEVGVYLAQDRAGKALPNAEELIERTHLRIGWGRVVPDDQDADDPRDTGLPHTWDGGADGGLFCSWWKVYQTVDIPGLGKQEEGSDGSVVWERSPVLGPRAKTRRGLNGLGMTLDAAEVIGWRYLVGQARTEALEQIDGRDCYRVRLTAKNGGLAALRWYDKSTGLLYRASISFKSDMGDVPAVLTYEEWRRVEGLKWPVRIRIAAAGQDMLFAADEVALNSSIAKDVFEVPEDIRKLAETRADRAGGMPGDMQ